MNRTLTSPDIVTSSKSQSNKFIHRVYLTWKHPRRWDRDDISGYLTDLSSINGPLRAVKGTEERNESQFENSLNIVARTQ
jgi:hypothetical protein